MIGVCLVCFEDYFAFSENKPIINCHYYNISVTNYISNEHQTVTYNTCLTGHLTIKIEKSERIANLTICNVNIYYTPIHYYMPVL